MPKPDIEALLSGAEAEANFEFIAENYSLIDGVLALDTLRQNDLLTDDYRNLLSRRRCQNFDNARDFAEILVELKKFNLLSPINCEYLAQHPHLTLVKFAFMPFRENDGLPGEDSFLRGEDSQFIFENIVMYTSLFIPGGGEWGNWAMPLYKGDDQTGNLIYGHIDFVEALTQRLQAGAEPTPGVKSMEEYIQSKRARGGFFPPAEDGPRSDNSLPAHSSSSSAHTFGSSTMKSL